MKHGNRTGRRWGRSPHLVFAGLFILQLAAPLLSQKILSGDPLAQLPPVTHKVDFEKEVFPIFQARCAGCHGETQQMGEFRLDTRPVALSFRAGTFG